MHSTTDWRQRHPNCNGLQLGLLLALPCWLYASAGLPQALRLLPWLGVVMLVVFAAELWCTYRRDWRPTSDELKRDISVFGLNLIADGAISALLAIVAVTLAGDALGWPLALQLALGLPLAEFGPYWLHRLSHRGGWLWKAHLLHHRPDKLNAANALTVHPLNAAWDTLARVLPLLLLGFSGEAILALSAFALTQSVLVHANIETRLGRLNRVLGTAELHRLHHSTDSSQAGNFGTTIPLWDHVFGSWRFGPGPHAAGVFEEAAYPTALQWGALLALPFRGLCVRRPCGARLNACRRSAASAADATIETRPPAAATAAPGARSQPSRCAPPSDDPPPPQASR
jgi:sterol desaturase/sphingolipid hydroxylase (fatty acid hydroxylase superfamily)